MSKNILGVINSWQPRSKYNLAAVVIQLLLRGKGGGCWKQVLLNKCFRTAIATRIEGTRFKTGLSSRLQLRFCLN